jgi:FdhD protein
MHRDPAIPYADRTATAAADAPATGFSQVAATVVRAAADTVAQREARAETVAEEVPVAMVYNGISHAVMLASPLDLEDFALGFSLSEGIVDSPADMLDIEVAESDLADATSVAVQEIGLTLNLRVTLRCFMRLKERRRTLAGRTGCGLCGTESLAEAVRPVRRAVAPVQVPAAALTRAMAELARRQPLQALTGAIHAAAWCDLEGGVRWVREDVGRHNALDKLIGHLAREGVDPATGFVAVTSRASYEMVHKTAHAGIGLLAAISAPTALAVRTAQAAGLTLAGFTRGDRSTLYAHAERVTTG